MFINSNSLERKSSVKYSVPFSNLYFWNIHPYVLNTYKNRMFYVSFTVTTKQKPTLDSQKINRNE